MNEKQRKILGVLIVVGIVAFVIGIYVSVYYSSVHIGAWIRNVPPIIAEFDISETSVYPYSIIQVYALIVDFNGFRDIQHVNLTLYSDVADNQFCESDKYGFYWDKYQGAGQYNTEAQYLISVVVQKLNRIAMIINFNFSIGLARMGNWTAQIDVFDRKMANDTAMLSFYVNFYAELTLHVLEVTFEGAPGNTSYGNPPINATIKVNGPWQLMIKGTNLTDTELNESIDVSNMQVNNVNSTEGALNLSYEYQFCFYSGDYVKDLDIKLYMFLYIPPGTLAGYYTGQVFLAIYANPIP